MNGIAGQSKDFEDVSEVSEPVSEGKDSDDESSSNWKEKIGQAIAILESCEKNKILLGKKSRVLEMDEEDKLMPCVELTEKIAMLAKICRGMNEDRGKLKESRSNVSNQATDLAKELTAERKKSGLLEEKLGETEKVLKLLFDESHDLKDICEKAIAKGKALEEYGRNLIEAKRLLESKVADCDKKFADRGSELQLLEERLLRQSAEQLPHAQVQFPGEKKTFSQQKAEFEEDVAHLQKSFMTQQNQWSVECYAQALDLKDAYSDCDAHCNRIKELETKLERIEALRDCESEVEIFREEVRSNVEETIGSHEAIGIKELGGQKLDPGSEVQQLRAQIFEERSIRAGLEDLRQRREAENREYLKELEERKIGMANLERDVDLKQRMYEMKDEELAKLKQEKNALSAEVEKLKQQCETEAQHTAALKSRLDILMEEKNRLLEEMAKIKEKNVNHKSCNDELKGKNQELNSASEASREEVLKLKESVEKLKHQVGRLQDEALEENVGQGDLSDETGASTENSKKGQSMPQSKAAKVEEKGKEQNQKSIDSEKQPNEEEASKNLIKQLEDKLLQKEAQLEVKNGELKKVLLRYSEMKNDKLRCEKEIESFILTEMRLIEKVQSLEPKVDLLEKHEKELVKKLDDKEKEIKNLNEQWGKIAAKGMDEITKAIRAKTP